MIEAVFTTGVDEITAHGLTQWDKGQKLKITLSSLPASFEVHFAFKRSETAYVVDATASNGVAIVNIPNAILRQPADAMAWIYLVNGDAGETVKTIHLPIERRTKPADYVYEEAEIANFREIVNQRIDEYIESGVIVPGATVEEVTKIREFTIDQVEFEHTGNPAQFDSFSGCPLNCVTHIEPVQAGSGDPYPAGGGKNLMPFMNSEQTSGGVTFKPQSDGRIHIEGTASANISYNLCGQWQSQTGVTLRAGYKYSRTTNITGVEAIAYGYNSGGAYKMIPEGTLTEDYSNAYIYLQVNSGRVVNGYFAPTLTVNGWSAEYIPYANIRPISGHTGAKLTKCGKNLLPNTAKTQTVNGVTFTVNNDGSVTANGTATATITFVLSTGVMFQPGSYILSGCPAGWAENNKFSLRWNGSNAIYDDIGSGVAISPTSEERVQFYILFREGATISNGVFKPMLRLASESDATYEPYHGETFSASFGQTVYGGTLDWGKGVLTVDGKIVTLTGGEDWKWFASYDFVYWTGLQSALKAWPEDLVCSHYKLSVDETQEKPYVTIVSTGTYNDQLRFYHTGYTSADAWKAFLTAQNAAGTPVQVCYKLATPTTIQLTPAQLTALQGMNNIFCDAGETTVSGRKDILWLTDYLLKRVKELESAVATLQTAAVNNV